jgi:hypothetical protein
MIRKGGARLQLFPLPAFRAPNVEEHRVAAAGAGLRTYKPDRPDAFLMVEAVGAACDFLTPIGHRCNTMVMAPGGDRFADDPRLGPRSA